MTVVPLALEAGLDISFLTRRCFGEASDLDPDSPAIVLESDDPLTYRELASRGRSYANALIGLGVAPGDRVGILLYNCVEYWLAYFAITRIGAIAVRLNFRLTPDELQYAIKDSGTSVLLADDDLLDRIEALTHTLPVRQYVRHGVGGRTWAIPWTVLTEASAAEPAVDLPTTDDPAMIMYTSGTTGLPKGALWTHGTTAWWTAMQVMAWSFGPQSVTMVTGPLYHIASLENYALPTLAAGGQVVMTRSKNFSIERTLRVASERRVTDLFLFPFMIYQMLRSQAVDQLDLTSVRRMLTGGDPLSPAAVEELAERFGWIDLVQVYGLTEGTPIVACGEPGFSRAHPESVGHTFPFCEISVRDDNGRKIGTGAAGEIWTRSPANSKGYWGKPEATAETFIRGWCRTGDLGVVENGALRITGRKKDMIRSGGENIYPIEIENILLRHPDIADVAVIGVPDDELIEVVCAVVVLAPGAEMTERDVVSHCAKSLAGYKKPRKVVFVDEIPRTGSQKIMKYRLRETYST